jgi:hypothetical protein
MITPYVDFYSSHIKVYLTPFEEDLYLVQDYLMPPDWMPGILQASNESGQKYGWRSWKQKEM